MHSVAKARYVDVTLDYSQEAFYLQFRDDGCGIDPASIERGKPRHFELVDMRNVRKSSALTLS